MELKDLGWNEFHRKHFDELKTPDSFPARVTQSRREKYMLYSSLGELKADIPGKIRFNAESQNDLPAVGDWVLAELRPEGDAAMIVGILPRMSKFSRKSAGGTMDEQVSVANIDTVFLVNGLDGDYNLRRIERYLALARESGAKPVVVLNKTDMSPDPEAKAAEVRQVALDAPVITLSALKNEGFEKLSEYISPGSTIAFLGSSGAGKSTMINRLMGEARQRVGAVRAADSRGRHITTQRELILLPGGGIVIDNPGFRELQLWVNDDTLDITFADIKALAAACKFTDCTHTDEPDCAVLAAIAAGTLDAKRLRSYQKLKREQKFLAHRHQSQARPENSASEKEIGRKLKQFKSQRSKERFGQ